jgi:hypothetical protein
LFEKKIDQARAEKEKEEEHGTFVMPAITTMST